MRAVLVTRPAAEAETTRAALAARGTRVLLDPLLTIVPCFAEAPAGPFDAVIATSANAFADRRNPAVAAGRALPLAVVGERTAAAAIAAGFAVPTVVAPTAAALVEAIAAAWREPRRCLLLAGVHQATDLAALLASLGHGVETAIVYDAVAGEDLRAASRQALRDGDVEAVLHYSARAAEAFLTASQRMDPPLIAGLRHICLSDRVAEPLRRAGLAAEVAAWPDETAMFERLDGSPASQDSERFKRGSR